MILLRTFGTDSNGGSSQFVGIPVPIGVQDGDIVLVAIAIKATGITVTPPDEDWTFVAQTDRTVATGLALFWKIALNEQGSWVFGLSSSISATGTALVYAHTDPYQPVEAFATRLTASSGTALVPSIDTSLDNEELALFVAGGAALTVTPPAGYLEVASHSQGALTLSAEHRNQVGAGSVGATTASLSSSAAGAAILVALRPGVGTSSIEEVFNRIVAALPRGADRVYDLTVTGDYGKYFRAIAAFIKFIAFDVLDLARLEVMPSTSRYKLLDWERFFGLETSRVARTGTIPARQRQVISAWRSATSVGGSVPEIQAALEPLMQYADPADIAILTTPRIELRDAHTYDFGGDTIPGPGSLTVQASSLDGDGFPVGKMGAQLFVFVDHPSVEDLSFTLTGPDGASKTWAAGSIGSGTLTPSDERRLYGVEFFGAMSGGIWTLTITSTGASGTLDHAGLFVEGIGRAANGPQGLGGDIFEWGAFIDPTKLFGGKVTSVHNVTLTNGSASVTVTAGDFATAIAGQSIIIGADGDGYIITAGIGTSTLTIDRNYGGSNVTAPRDWIVTAAFDYAGPLEVVRKFNQSHRCATIVRSSLTVGIGVPEPPPDDDNCIPDEFSPA